MNPQAAKSALSVALFVVITALFSLTLVQWGTAESIVAVLSLVVGLLAIGIIAFVIRKFSR